MKVMVNGKEIEIEENTTPEERSFEEEKEKETKEENLEDTLELTEEEQKALEGEMNHDESR